jgi:hypothetical protein
LTGRDGREASSPDWIRESARLGLDMGTRSRGRCAYAWFRGPICGGKRLATAGRRSYRRSIVIKVPGIRSPYRDGNSLTITKQVRASICDQALISAAKLSRESNRISKIVSLAAPPAGFEPAHPPPEGGALSPELWGLAHMVTSTELAKGPSKSIRSTDRWTRRRSAHISWPKPITSRRDSGTWPRAGCRR